MPIVSSRDNAYTEDPLLGFSFLLDAGGKAAGYFTECSGVGSENEIIEHKVVDENGNDVIRKIPGRLKWQDVTLKRGITSDLEIWAWRQEVVDGKIGDARQDITITMLDTEGNQRALWNFSKAWPSKVSGPTFKADSNEYGLEEMTITHEGMYRDTA